MILKGQIEVIKCLVGCISWIVHVIIWMCVNNEQIWLPGNYGSDYKQYLNRLQLDLISRLVNFSHELAQIMTTYGFRSAKQAILSNVRTKFNLTQFLFLSTFDTSDFEKCLNRFQLDTFSLLVSFSHELAHIMTTYSFLSFKQAILSNVQTDFNLTQFRFWSTFDMNWHK